MSVDEWPRACLTYRGLLFIDASCSQSNRFPLHSRCVDMNTKDDTNNRWQKKVLSFQKYITARFFWIRRRTDLIDFAWGAREMHCGSVRPFGSVACVKKLRYVQLFKQRRIRRPIRSRLCKYTPRVYWIHFAIISRKKTRKIWPLYFFQEMWNARIVFSHLLFVSYFVFMAASYSGDASFEGSIWRPLESQRRVKAVPFQRLCQMRSRNAAFFSRIWRVHRLDPSIYIL